MYLTSVLRTASVQISIIFCLLTLMFNCSEPEKIEQEITLNDQSTNIEKSTSVDELGEFFSLELSRKEIEEYSALNYENDITISSNTVLKEYNFLFEDTDIILDYSSSSNLRIATAEVMDELEKHGFSEGYRYFINKILALTNDLDNSSSETVKSSFNEIKDELYASELEDYEGLSIEMTIDLSIKILDQAVDESERAFSYSNSRIHDACLDKEKARAKAEMWRNVARNAIAGGITAGIGTGIYGIQAGATAGLAGGNPLVGGLVGGAAGFTYGFFGGSLAAGLATYAAYKAVPIKLNKQNIQECRQKASDVKLRTNFTCLDAFCRKKVYNLPSFQIKPSWNSKYKGSFVYHRNQYKYTPGFN